MLYCIVFKTIWTFRHRWRSVWRHFGTGAEMSRTLRHQILVPKCLGTEVSLGRSVRKACHGVGRIRWAAL